MLLESEIAEEKTVTGMKVETPDGWKDIRKMTSSLNKYHTLYFELRLIYNLRTKKSKYSGINTYE